MTVKNIFNGGISRKVEVNDADLTVKSSWFIVSYVTTLIEKFKRFNGDNVRVSFLSPNKLSKYIKVHKDSLAAFFEIKRCL